ncbi:hypothetical protein BMS3Abin15_00320 [bacterium BMS3Abin15]|nr:hypothetical protein BMS3Abin15_00320 [bacterium BMS3Abin15]HDZ85087.1 carboxypeptidase regulatory-like domain-containing protein [Candidatus Moranbacteria bacterium]
MLDNKNKKSKIKKGFTLIEALALLFIFSVVVVTFYSVFTLGMSHIIESKKRLGAVSIANQKIEIIRNLAYDNIGIEDGIPDGPIDSDEYETVDKITYHVLTDIKYYDDPFDGTQGGSPNDDIPNDYKVARVTVKWGQELTRQEVFLASTFVPPGRETNAGGGTLAINIINSSGGGVPSVDISLTNGEVGVDLDTVTDSEGNLLLPGAPASMNKYEIGLSKNGYETIVTMPPYPGTAYNPTDEHASVIEGLLNVKAIIMDPLSDINITTIDPLDIAIGDVSFSLIGGRTLGTDIDTGDPIYNYDEDLTSDSGGAENVDDVSPGTYQFTLTGNSETDYKLFKMDPGDDLENSKFILDPGSSLDINAVIADKSIPSLIVTVKDDAGGSVEEASVSLVNTTHGYDVTLETDKYGTVYFPDNTANLENDDYDISISATGFSDENGTVTINDLTEEEFVLNPI